MRGGGAILTGKKIIPAVSLNHPWNSLERRGAITTDWISFLLLNFRLCYSYSAYSYGSYISQQMQLMQGYSK